MAEPTVERAHPPIVAAVDGSEVSRRALRRAGSLAAALGAELIVVHGVGLLEGAGYRDHVELEEVVIAELGPERARGAPAVRTVVQDGPAALVVARVVADHGAAKRELDRVTLHGDPMRGPAGESHKFTG